MNLWKQLNLSYVLSPQVIVLVGSGGKTSLLGQLAKEGKEHNLRVAVLTTTHMYEPPCFWEAFCDRPNSGTITVYGKSCGNGKITYPGDLCYEQICKNHDLILIEADGSKGLPVKYPADYEPVIPENVNKIICVQGMSGFQREARDVCHRWELYPEQEKENKMTTDLMADLLESGYGNVLTEKFPKADFCYCLNQADTEELQQVAEEILRKTGRKGLITSLKGENNILYTRKVALIYMASGFGKRYGANKLLDSINGKPMYRYGMETLKNSVRNLENIEATLVVVSQYEEILQEAKGPGMYSVYNPNSHLGITASIHLGIQAVPDADAHLFAVADQPWLKPESVTKLINEFYHSEKTIACVFDGNRRGNPVIFDGKYKEELLALQGDRGGSVVMKKYPDEVLEVMVDSKELEDVDEPLQMNVLEV